MSDGTIAAQVPTPGVSGDLVIKQTGNWRELLPIVLVNLLLNIVTLGFYRFWGKTKVRRYLWRHTVLNDTPFEYTGTGLELFLGFLIASVIFLVLVFGSQLIVTTQPEPAVIFIYQFVFFIFVIFFTGFAVYRARRYRLSRTNWRGIRGGTTGSAMRHGLRWLGFYTLLFITSGLTLPWVRKRLVTPLTRESQLGGTNFAINAPASPLYLPFLACIGISWGVFFAIFIILGIVVALSAIFSSGELTELFNSIGTSLESNTEPEVGKEALGYIAGFGLVILVATYLMIPAIFSVYFVYETRHFLSHTSYGGMKIKIDARGGEMIKLALGNFFLVLITLGIAAPLVQLRNFKFFINRARLEGALDLESLVQSNALKPSTGEGWAEMFDVGNV